MITFAQPVWFVLAIPLGILWYLWPMPTRLLKFLRAMGFLSLLLAMCQPAIKLPDRAGTIVVVVDRSDSMPAGSSTRQKEAIDLMQKAMGSRDHLAVVSFGHRAVVERPPQAGAFGGFAAEVGSDASSLAEGIETAMALIPPETPGRIIVISDGKWTGRDPLSSAAMAAGRGIAIDHRVLSRPQVQDLAIQEFHTPDSVLPGQAFVTTAWVRSPATQTIRYQLKNGNRTISEGEREVPAGLSRLLFRDQALQPGTAQYRLQINAAETDSVPENNTARALVGVRGAKPILALSSSGDQSGLVKLLRGGRVELIGANPSDVRWSLEQLSQFSAVLIENVMAASIGTPGMETIASWVEQSGSGLMLTGGKKSYAPGGYFGSPLERVIPVSMEMRREHRKLRLAIVVALDRSGSMAASVGAGKTKMDLANLGASAGSARAGR